MNPELSAILGALPPYAGHEAAAPMLPKQCYTSPEFFEFERQAVFARNWVCVGRADQIAAPGDAFPVTVAGEPLIVVRGAAGDIRAMGAVCQHRGHVLSCGGDGPKGLFRCPLHFWTYDLDGRLVGAPRMGDALASLRDTVRLPPVRAALWHGFIFVNLDGDAPPLTPSLAKVEPLWEGYPETEMVTVPPVQATTPLPWNWKIQLENFTDAYHPEFVHTGTHDFAPSVLAGSGVEFTPMADGDNAIVRSVPMLSPDGGMMRDGWGPEAMFPPIAGLSSRQHNWLSFVMVPPNLQLMFAPGAVSYTLLVPGGAEATYASSDRVTGGGWILPRSTVALPISPSAPPRCARAPARSGRRTCRSTTRCRPANARASCRRAATARSRRHWCSSTPGCWAPIAGRRRIVNLAALNRAGRAEFTAVLGAVFEHSPWVAEAAWPSAPFATVEALHAAMVAAVRAASAERRLTLIRAHPDLAGKAARGGTMTASSVAEQSAAGLLSLGDDEFERFHRLNAAYRERFGFPFIIAVRRHTKESLLNAFEARLGQSRDGEIETALAEIFSITRQRLDALLAE